MKTDKTDVSPACFKMTCGFIRFLCARMCALIAIAALSLFVPIADAAVVVYPAPPGEVLSTNYTIEVDGKPVVVYLAQTQHEDKRPYSFAYFDFSGLVTVKIKTDVPLDKLEVRPSKYGIKPTIDHGEATFTVDKPFNISFEPTGENIPLLLFGNPIEKDAPKPGDTNVIYFGPGIHKPTRIDLTSGQTLYIAGGAVVQSSRHLQRAITSASWGGAFWTVTTGLTPPAPPRAWSGRRMAGTF